MLGLWGRLLARAMLRRYGSREEPLGAHVATSPRTPGRRLPFNGALLRAWLGFTGDGHSQAADSPDKAFFMLRGQREMGEQRSAVASAPG